MSTKNDATDKARRVSHDAGGAVMKPAIPRASWMRKTDGFLMFAGFALALIFSLALGHGRIFWEDEMLGWMLLTDPSWHHMVQAWKMGADGGGFAFYVTCRVWLHLFGPSEVAFRMYSAVCFGVAFVINWVVARRFYGCWTVGFALFNTYFCSPPIVLHLVEGRFYGLLMMATALTVWLAVRSEDLPQRVPLGWYLAMFAAHALLTTSHLLGVVYSFFVLGGMVVTNRLAGRWQPGLYVAGALSWLLLVPELPAIRASAAVGKPWFWTVQPTAKRLLGPLTAFSGEVALVMLVLALLASWSVWRAGSAWRSVTTAYRRRRSVYITTAALLMVPVAFLVERFFGASLFTNRYLIPVSIATTFLTAELLTLIDWRGLLPARLRSFPTMLRGASAAALAGVIGVWVFWHLPGYIMAQEAYTSKLSAMLPKGVPVLLEDAWTFTEVIGREHDSGVQYLYPLDWQQTVSPYAPRLEVTQYNLMNNWRKAGYFSGSIVYLKDFLARTPEFLVLDAQVPRDATARTPDPPAIGNPLALRFAATPGYSVQRYAAMDRRGLIMTAWIVKHNPPSTGLPLNLAPK